MVPFPKSDSNLRVPLCSCIIEYAIERPSPVPSPGDLVVKKGSVIFYKSSLLIPDPVSAIFTSKLPL